MVSKGREIHPVGQFPPRLLCGDASGALPNAASANQQERAQDEKAPERITSDTAAPVQ